MRVESSIDGVGTGQAISLNNDIQTTISGGYVEWNYGGTAIEMIRSQSCQINDVMISARTSGRISEAIKTLKTRRSSIRNCRVKTLHNSAHHSSVDDVDFSYENNLHL